MAQVIIRPDSILLKMAADVFDDDNTTSEALLLRARGYQIDGTVCWKGGRTFHNSVIAKHEAIAVIREFAKAYEEILAGVRGL